MKGIDVKEKLQKDRYSLKEIADLMGETPQNFQAMFKAEDIKTGILERIAKAIGKDILYFYEIENEDSKLHESQLAIDITNIRRKVYRLYQRIVDIDIILDEKFSFKRQGGYASDVAHLCQLVFKNYELISSGSRFDEDGDEVEYVFIDEWSFDKKEKYNNQLKEASEALTTAFFDRFKTLKKKLSGVEFPPTKPQ